MKAKASLLRFPPSLHQRLTASAERAGLSFNQFCVNLLASAVTAPEAAAPPWLKTVLRLYEGEGLLAVVLFGSHARGQARESSDLDLLLVFGPQVEIHRSLYRRFEDLSWQSRELRDVSLHCARLLDLSKGEPSSLWLEVALEGKILWSKDDTAAKLLNELKARIAKGAYLRKDTHGQGYWVKR